MNVKVELNGKTINVDAQVLANYYAVAQGTQPMTAVPEEHVVAVQEFARLNGLDLNAFCTLEELKALKVKELNAECRTAIEAGFLHDGILFKARMDPDQVNIALSGLKLVMDPAAFVPWEAADNTVVVFTAETFPAFASSFGAHFLQQHGKVRTLKDAALAATTREELAQIVWQE